MAVKGKNGKKAKYLPTPANIYSKSGTRYAGVVCTVNREAGALCDVGAMTNKQAIRMRLSYSED